MLSTEPARIDLTSRECAKLICGLLSGLIPLLDDDDALEIREVLSTIKGKSVETKWEQSAGLRVTIHAIGALIGALVGMTKEDPEQLRIAIEWVSDTDEVWEKFNNG